MKFDGIREGSRAWKLINYALLNAAWFGCVLPVAGGNLALTWGAGVAVLVVHFLLTRDRRTDALLMLVTVAIGAASETVTGGLGAYVANGDPLQSPLPPTWILLLWAVFAITLRHCLAWLCGRWALAAILGAIGGPLAMLGGARLGALTVAESHGLFWLLVGAQWGVVLPLLLRITARIAPPRPRP